MATNQLIKQAFGNHNMITEYILSLTDPDILPPFPPILYRQIGHSGEINVIMTNAKSRHEAVNQQVKNELIRQFAIYQQLQNGE